MATTPTTIEVRVIVDDGITENITFYNVAPGDLDALIDDLDFLQART